MENSWKDLFHQLIEEGGAIVLSNECSEMELADARMHHRMFVNEDGFGFVRRTEQWLNNAKMGIDIIFKNKLDLDSQIKRAVSAERHRLLTALQNTYKAIDPLTLAEVFLEDQP